MRAGDRADLALERSLKLGIEEHDEAVVRRQLDSVRLCFPQCEIAVGSIFEPRIDFGPTAKLSGLDTALQLVLGPRRLLYRDHALGIHALKHGDGTTDGGRGGLQRIASVRVRAGAVPQ